MKQTVLLALLAGAFAGAVITPVVNIATSSAPAAKAAAVVPGGGPDTMLQTQIDELRAESRSLGDRIDMLGESLAGLDGGRIPVAASSIDLDELAARVAALQEAVDGKKSAVPLSFRNNVAAALDSIREEEERAREQEREDARVQRLEDRLGQLASDLGLDDFQVGEMRTILNNEALLRNELMAGMRDGGDMGNMRDTMRELRDQTRESLSTVLSEEQLQKYQEQDRGFGRGGFGGGGFGGGGRGGGRGGG